MLCHEKFIFYVFVVFIILKSINMILLDFIIRYNDVYRVQYCRNKKRARRDVFHYALITNGLWKPCHLFHNTQDHGASVGHMSYMIPPDPFLARKYIVSCEDRSGCNSPPSCDILLIPSFI